jgi:hypothetical protein
MRWSFGRILSTLYYARLAYRLRGAHLQETPRRHALES